MISLSTRRVLVGVAVVNSLWLLAGCQHSSPGPHAAVTLATTNAPSWPNPPPPAVANPVEKIQPPPPLSSADTLGADVLVWDAKKKTYPAKPGDQTAPFTFTLKNVSSEELVIYATDTTCGCTAAPLPVTPWKIPPGGTGELAVTIDLKGKTGTLVKGVTVFTSKGNSLLTVETTIP